MVSTRKQCSYFPNSLRNAKKSFIKSTSRFSQTFFQPIAEQCFFLKNCMNDSSDQIYGMESTDGDVNLEMNFEIENHSITQTIYAIECYKDKNKQ